MSASERPTFAEPPDYLQGYHAGMRARHYGAFAYAIDPALLDQIRLQIEMDEPEQLLHLIQSIALRKSLGPTRADAWGRARNALTAAIAANVLANEPQLDPDDPRIPPGANPPPNPPKAIKLQQAEDAEAHKAAERKIEKRSRDQDRAGEPAKPDAEEPNP